ncbi:MAG: hypothetical protein CL840_10800 [Crocinitomicaceae bacterium]|nr:hypothetical protein [Crocinitomicaceae bacterium]
MYRISLFTLLFLVFNSALLAQDYVDLFKFTYLNSPFNKEDSVEGPARVQEFYVDLTVPIKLSDRTAIITGAIIEQLSVNTSPSGFNVTSVFSTTLKLGVNLSHGKRWQGTYIILPKVAGDFNHSPTTQIQLGGLALYKFNKKDNLKYRIGLYYNTELFGPFFVPLLGVYYLSPNKKFEMNFTLPVWADMNYRFTEHIAAGLNFSAFLRSYNISPASTVSGKEMYMVKASNEIYGYLQYTAKKSFIFQAKAGWSIGRRFSAYDIDEKVGWGFSAFRFDDDRTQQNRDISDGFIFQARFIYRFNLEPSDKSDELGLK